MRTLAISNYKGGVGKTTTAVNLAAIYAARGQRLRFALDDASGDFDTCIIDCSPVMKRLAFNAYLAASGDGMVVIPVKLDGSVMRGTALTVNATRAIADALRMPTPRYRILRTCVPGRETRSVFRQGVLS